MATETPLERAVVLTVGLSAGIVIAWFQRFVFTRTETTIALAITASVCLVVLGLFAVAQVVSRDWFYPLAFPTAYVSLVLLLPSVFLLGTGRAIGVIQSTDVSIPLLIVFLLTIAGFAVGAQLAVIIFRQPRPSRDRGPSIDYRRLLIIGRIILLSALLLRAIEIPSVIGIPYGTGALTYGFETWARVAANGFIFIAIVLIVISNSQVSGTTLLPVDKTVFSLFCIATLFTGSRGELIAPAIFILWAHHRFVRPIPFWRGFVSATVVIFAFTLVTVFRSNEVLDLSQSSGLVERALVSIGTPTFITARVLEEVPGQYGHTGGSTYWAALEGQLPGPVARAVLGDPDETGTFVFRSIIGFTNPDAGLGFSLPSESYLNFGFGGALVVAILVGVVFGYGYRRQNDQPSRALHLLYPLLVATLPLSLRSDALAQIKSVAYPLIAIAIAFQLSRAMRRSEEAFPKDSSDYSASSS